MRDRSSRSRPVRVLVSLLVLHASLLTSLLLSEPAAANPTHPGKWTNAFPWGGTAVNLILLPGGSTGKHSQLLWWTHDDTARVLGGLWGWSAPDAATD